MHFKCTDILSNPCSWKSCIQLVLNTWGYSRPFCKLNQPSWSWRKKLRYESSTLILYKELSSPIFQSLSVSEWVSQSGIGNSCADLHGVHYIKAQMPSTDSTATAYFSFWIILDITVVGHFVLEVPVIDVVLEINFMGFKTGGSKLQIKISEKIGTIRRFISPIVLRIYLKTFPIWLWI